MKVAIASLFLSKVEDILFSFRRQAQDGRDLRDVPLALGAGHLHGALAQPVGGLRLEGQLVGQGVPNIIPRHRR